MDVSFMDPRSAKLAVQFQLEDIEELLDGLYDDAPEGDERDAYEIIQADLQAELQRLEGQVLALSLINAEHESRLTFRRLLQEEKQAVGDHDLAMRLAGIKSYHPDVQSGNDYAESLYEDSDTDEDEQWATARELYANACRIGAIDMGDRPPIHGVCTIKAGEVQKHREDLIVLRVHLKCHVCMEDVLEHDTLTLSCKSDSHTYCRNCLIDLFHSAVRDPIYFPPRCCHVPLPLDTCRAMLPKTLMKDFDLKAEELTSPNPTYCSDPACANFICPKDIKNGVGCCPFCHGKTCVLCKTKEHQGLCPEDPHVKLLMESAQRSKWQQCGQCKNLVELDVGCFHMTCRCKHEFCYLCGAKWKTCKCPQWEENYLVQNARRQGVEPAAALAAAEAIARVAPANCNRGHAWGDRKDTHNARCHQCQADYLPWLLRCTRCEAFSCWRCARNR